jgi:hypothetical protein
LKFANSFNHLRETHLGHNHTRHEGYRTLALMNCATVFPALILLTTVAFVAIQGTWRKSLVIDD